MFQVDHNVVNADHRFVCLGNKGFRYISLGNKGFGYLSLQRTYWIYMTA